MKKTFISISGIAVFAISVFAASAQGVNRSRKIDQGIYTPAPKSQPRINGPLVYGCHPGHPFLYRIPCQGERPIMFSIKDLPAGLSLDTLTGIITGNAPTRGEYNLVIKAVNSKGKDHRNWKIVSGDKLALTPPMGWNHWYAHYDRITDKMVREAATI